MLWQEMFQFLDVEKPPSFYIMQKCSLICFWLSPTNYLAQHGFQIYLEEHAFILVLCQVSFVFSF